MNEFHALNHAEMANAEGGHAAPHWASGPFGAFLWEIVHAIIHFLEDFAAEHGSGSGGSFTFDFHFS